MRWSVIESVTKTSLGGAKRSLYNVWVTEQDHHERQILENVSPDELAGFVAGVAMAEVNGWEGEEVRDLRDAAAKVGVYA